MHGWVDAWIERWIDARMDGGSKNGKVGEPQISQKEHL